LKLGTYWLVRVDCDGAHGARVFQLAYQNFIVKLSAGEVLCHVPGERRSLGKAHGGRESDQGHLKTASASYWTGRFTKMPPHFEHLQ
jgi:hypothetical protein